MGTKAQQRSIAFVLVRMAESASKPELRAALPLLKPGISSPFEFTMLRRRLKAALGEGNLPIPATPLQATQDLPIPTEELL